MLTLATLSFSPGWRPCGPRRATAPTCCAPEPAAAAVAAAPTPAMANAKAELLRLALLSGRGAWARPAESERTAALVEELEASSEQPAQLTDGCWDLVLSDVEPFRASAFFLALGEAVESNIMSGAADGALTVHSLATGGGEVGRVAHVIEGDGRRLHSLVELRSGSLPSLPLALRGTVISSAELSARPAAAGGAAAARPAFELALKNTSVQENTLLYGLPQQGGLKPGAQRDALAWIGDQLVPSGDIFSSVLDPLGGGQLASLELSYADGELMVRRTPRDPRAPPQPPRPRQPKPPTATPLFPTLTAEPGVAHAAAGRPLFRARALRPGRLARDGRAAQAAGRRHRHALAARLGLRAGDAQPVLQPQDAAVRCGCGRWP